MPTGSGSPMIVAGSCRTGVRSFQLDARNSIDAIPVSPATNRTSTSASAKQTFRIGFEQALRTTRTKAWSRRRYATAPPIKASVESVNRASSSAQRNE